MKIRLCDVCNDEIVKGLEYCKVTKMKKGINIEHTMDICLKCIEKIKEK